MSATPWEGYFFGSYIICGLMHCVALLAELVELVEVKGVMLVVMKIRKHGMPGIVSGEVGADGEKGI
jgi:hypothetical protein